MEAASAAAVVVSEAVVVSVEVLVVAVVLAEVVLVDRGRSRIKLIGSR